MSFTKSIESRLESRRRAREAGEYCEQHNIPSSPEYETDNTAHISAQSPDSGPSEAYYSGLEVVQTYQKLAEKLFRWRPPAELNQKMALAFKGEGVLQTDYRRKIQTMHTCLVGRSNQKRVARKTCSCYHVINFIRREDKESSNKRIGWRQTSRRPEKSDPHNTSTGSQSMDMALVRNDE